MNVSVLWKYTTRCNMIMISSNIVVFIPFKLVHVKPTERVLNRVCLLTSSLAPFCDCMKDESKGVVQCLLLTLRIANIDPT